METINRNAHLKQWILEQISRINEKFAEILINEFRVELVHVKDDIRMEILLNVLVKLIRIISFPPFNGKYLDRREELMEEYDEFADTFNERIVEICHELYSWRPELTSALKSEGVEESPVA